MATLAADAGEGSVKPKRKKKLTKEGRLVDMDESGDTGFVRYILDGVVTLVGAGFKEEDVWDFTFKKFHGYLETVYRRTLQSRIDSVVDLTISISGMFEPKRVKEHISTLEKASS